MSEVVSKLLAHGMDKEAKVKAMEACARPVNCERLEAVQVNAEIFNSVRKETKTEDVMHVQKPLLAGITKLVHLMDKGCR